MTVNAEVADVMKQVRQRTVLLVSVRGNLKNAAKLLDADPLVESVEIQGDRIAVTLSAGVEDYSELASKLVEAGYPLTRFCEEDVSLESAFMTLTRGMGAKT